MLRRLSVVAGAAVIAAGLAGCSQPLVVDPAPYAADPDCARVMLAMPDTLGGLPVRATSSQATSAWGDEYPIIARCGVEPPGPTTDECLAVDATTGTQDWIILDKGDHWDTIAFGRSPALELIVPKVRAQDAVGDVLAEVSGAAGLAPSNGLSCK